jgi:hypothetical protein
MAEALRGAFSGRLEWHPDGYFDYCTGQYYPTEYRSAAAAVLEHYVELVRPKSLPPKNQKFNSIEDIKSANYNAGQHYFSRDTMRFFRSRVLDEIFNGPGGIYFVTSEKGPHSSRAYTVRKFNPETADICTAGEFNKIKSRETALRYARKYSLEGAPTK